MRPTSDAKLSPEQQKAEEVFQHFKREFAADPVGALARFFRKSSCQRCHGKGLELVVGSTLTDLRLCGCARRRLGRHVVKSLLFQAARERGGLAFAEGTVCHEAELALPVAAPHDDLPRAA